jgi:glycosyltransferase involved in cell wall biosynthesis
MPPPTDGLPLVSCIMPTCDRRRFLPAAIRYFLRQDFPNKELVIVDDGVDAVGDLASADARIRYVRLSRRATVGAKRNLACEHAAGDLIAHWDDDD